MRSFIAAIFLLFSTGAYAQTTFTVQHDTVSASVGAGATVLDGISAVTDTVSIVWKVVASDFPADWVADNAICDNRACYVLGTLWSASTGTLTVKTSKPYGIAHLDTPGGDYHMLVGFSDTSSIGCHYLTVRMNNALLPSDTTTETYLICNNTLAAPTITKPGSEIIVYPNPAHDDVNIICNTSLEANKVFVCDLTGKVLANYHMPGNGRLDLHNFPTGIYLLRFADASGKTLATKQLIRQ